MALPAFTKTFVLVATVFYVGLPKRGGSWLIVVVPILIVCTLYALVRIVMRPAEQRARTIQLAAWLATAALVGATQAYWSAAARRTAEAVAIALVVHKDRTGSLPASLSLVGFNEGELLENWRLTYKMQDGEAELTYPAQVIPLSTHEYDFKTRTWKLNAY